MRWWYFRFRTIFFISYRYFSDPEAIHADVSLCLLWWRDVKRPTTLSVCIVFLYVETAVPCRQEQLLASFSLTPPPTWWHGCHCVSCLEKQKRQLVQNKYANQNMLHVWICSLNWHNQESQTRNKAASWIIQPLWQWGKILSEESFNKDPETIHFVWTRWT